MKRPCVCLLWCPLVPAGGVARDVLWWPCRSAKHLDKAPACTMQTMSLTTSSYPGRVPQILKSYLGSSIFSMWSLSLYSLFCSSCSVVSQVSLRRIYLNIYKCAFDVFMGGRSTTYSYGAIWTHLPGYFNIEKPLL